MTIPHENVQYGAHAGTIDPASPVLTGLDILGVVVAAVMLLLPLTAGGTHYSGVGWEKTETAGER
jgi:hypothetical protein